MKQAAFPLLLLVFSFVNSRYQPATIETYSDDPAYLDDYPVIEYMDNLLKENKQPPAYDDQLTANPFPPQSTTIKITLTQQQQLGPLIPLNPPLTYAFLFDFLSQTRARSKSNSRSSPPPASTSPGTTSPSPPPPTPPAPSLTSARPSLSPPPPPSQPPTTNSPTGSAPTPSTSSTSKSSPPTRFLSPISRPTPTTSSR